MREMVGTPRIIKLLNKDVIEEIIKFNGPITKPEISKLTNLSLVTVNKTVEILVLEKKVKASGINPSTGGRRAQFYEINEELNYNIGLYYYKDVFIGAISNSIGEITYEEEFSVRVDSYDGVMEDIYHAIDSLIKRCETHNITAIGIGVPGVVQDGFITNVPNIASWEKINVASIIEDKYKITVLLENDINLATMGVYYSDYKEKLDSLVLIYLEQGIGSGIILNKELFKGATNYAGELSNIPVRSSITVDNKKTKYKGNFENKISFINDELVSDRCNNYDELKSILISTIIDGLLSIICILNPEIIIIIHDQLSEDDMNKMEKVIASTINEENTPKIVKINDLRKYGIQGVINMCIRETLPIYSLSSRKRG